MPKFLESHIYVLEVARKKKQNVFRGYLKREGVEENLIEDRNGLDSPDICEFIKLQQVVDQEKNIEVVSKRLEDESKGDQEIKKEEKGVKKVRETRAPAMNYNTKKTWDQDQIEINMSKTSDKENLAEQKRKGNKDG